jgi:hypothetical protein
MINVEAGRYGAPFSFPDDLVNALHLSSVVNVAIAPTVFAACPFPAAAERALSYSLS